MQQSYCCVLLGVAQDAGLPHTLCNCKNCNDVRNNKIRCEDGFAVCLAIVDNLMKKFWLIDATPDIKNQLHYMTQNYSAYKFSGILLTHLHMGHYAGLLQLGKESADTKQLDLYVTQKVVDFLKNNQPWAFQIERKNFEIRIIEPKQEFWLSEGISVTPISVPHRGEFSDTMSFKVKYQHQNGANKRCQRGLFYCPDIDDWKKWDIDFGSVFSDVDFALVDGSFYDTSELPGRDINEIPHPFIDQSVQFFSSRMQGLYNLQICFIHLNHSNPCWQLSEKRERVESLGFSFGKFGQIF